MLVDMWLNGEALVITPDVVSQALKELDEELKEIKGLALKGKYWEAYKRLVACISFLSIAAQQQPGDQTAITRRLLDWVETIKPTVDNIVWGLGGNSYIIGVSAPLGGISISVSFPVK